MVYAFLIFSCSSSREDFEVKGTPYISLVRLNGTIMPTTSFSSDRVIPELSRAFADTYSKGVILLINSPGGSAVQSSIIHDKILGLKKRYRKKVVVVGEDALASGAYLVATAADKIYVNRDTLTGSIGVLMGGFGFVDAMKKLGITRRLFTAGRHKVRLDPFRKLNSQDITKVKRVLNQVHQHFIHDVLIGRGRRNFPVSNKKLFSGDFWTGAQALKLGLVDHTGNLWNAMSREFKVEHYKDYTSKMSLLHVLIKEIDTELTVHLMENLAPLREQAY